MWQPTAMRLVNDKGNRQHNSEGLSSPSQRLIWEMLSSKLTNVDAYERQKVLSFDNQSNRVSLCCYSLLTQQHPTYPEDKPRITKKRSVYSRPGNNRRINTHTHREMSTCTLVWRHTHKRTTHTHKNNPHAHLYLSHLKHKHGSWLNMQPVSSLSSCSSSS